MTDPNEGRLVVDLDPLEFIEPYALVSVAAAVDAAVMNSVTVAFQAPARVSRRNYLSRMRLGSAMDALDVPHGLPPVNEQPLPDTLIELQTFETYAAVEGLNQLVRARLSSNYQTFGRMDAALQVLAELCNNAEEHAGAGHAYVAAQVYDADTPRQRIALAIGDAGQGLAGSLRAAGFRVDSDGHAVEQAMTSEVSASRQDGRGNGLPDSWQLVRECEGWATIRSNTARREQTPGGVEDRTVVGAPGTVVGATIPCGVAAGTHARGGTW